MTNLWQRNVSFFSRTSWRVLNHVSLHWGLLIYFDLITSFLVKSQFECVLRFSEAVCAPSSPEFVGSRFSLPTQIELTWRHHGRSRHGCRRYRNVPADWACVVSRLRGVYDLNLSAEHVQSHDFFWQANIELVRQHMKSRKKTWSDQEYIIIFVLEEVIIQLILRRNTYILSLILKHHFFRYN